MLESSLIVFRMNFCLSFYLLNKKAAHKPSSVFLDFFIGEGNDHLTNSRDCSPDSCGLPGNCNEADHLVAAVEGNVSPYLALLHAEIARFTLRQRRSIVTVALILP